MTRPAVRHVLAEPPPFSFGIVARSMVSGVEDFCALTAGRTGPWTSVASVRERRLGDDPAGCAAHRERSAGVVQDSVDNA
jgi:hypothetical protein